MVIAAGALLTGCGSQPHGLSITDKRGDEQAATHLFPAGTRYPWADILGVSLRPTGHTLRVSFSMAAPPPNKAGWETSYMIWMPLPGDRAFGALTLDVKDGRVSGAWSIQYPGKKGYKGDFATVMPHERTVSFSVPLRDVSRHADCWTANADVYSRRHPDLLVDDFAPQPKGPYTGGDPDPRDPSSCAVAKLSGQHEP